MTETKDLGSRFQYDLIAFLIKRHCLWFVRLVLIVCVLYYTLVPHIRARSRTYLDHRFPNASFAAHLTHCFRLHLSLALVLLDRLVFGVTGTLPRIPETAVAKAVLRSMVQAKQGTIVLTAHVGAWQTGLVALQSLGIPVHVVEWQRAGDGDRPYFERGFGMPFTRIDARDPIGCAIAVRSALARGDIVCMMGDRLTPEIPKKHTCVVPFLGGYLRLPLSPYILARITGAAVVLFSARVHGRLALISAKELPRTNDPLSAATLYVEALADFVAAYPYQFFNFFALWEATAEREPCL